MKSRLESVLHKPRVPLLPILISLWRDDERVIGSSGISHPSAESLLHSRRRLLRVIWWQFDDQIHVMLSNVVQPPLIRVVSRDAIRVNVRHIDTLRTNNLE